MDEMKTNVCDIISAKFSGFGFCALVPKEFGGISVLLRDMDLPFGQEVDVRAYGRSWEIRECDGRVLCCGERVLAADFRSVLGALEKSFRKYDEVVRISNITPEKLELSFKSGRKFIFWGTDDDAACDMFFPDGLCYSFYSRKGYFVLPGDVPFSFDTAEHYEIILNDGED